METYDLYCFTFDGNFVIEKEGFKTIDSTWNHANEMGSKWFFYPFHFIVKGKKIVDSPEMLEHFNGCTIKQTAKHFKKVSKSLAAQDVDCIEYSFLL